MYLSLSLSLFAERLSCSDAQPAGRSVDRSSTACSRLRGRDKCVPSNPLISGAWRSFFFISSFYSLFFLFFGRVRFSLVTSAYLSPTVYVHRARAREPAVESTKSKNRGDLAFPRTIIVVVISLCRDGRIHLVCATSSRSTLFSSSSSWRLDRSISLEERRITERTESR